MQDEIYIMYIYMSTTRKKKHIYVSIHVARIFLDEPSSRSWLADNF